MRIHYLYIYFPIPQLPILTTSQLLIFPSSHLLILDIFPSSQLLIFSNLPFIFQLIVFPCQIYVLFINVSANNAFCNLCKIAQPNPTSTSNLKHILIFCKLSCKMIALVEPCQLFLCSLKIGGFSN